MQNSLFIFTLGRFFSCYLPPATSGLKTLSTSPLPLTLRVAFLHHFSIKFWLLLPQYRNHTIFESKSAVEAFKFYWNISFFLLMALRILGLAFFHSIYNKYEFLTVSLFCWITASYIYSLLLFLFSLVRSFLSFVGWFSSWRFCSAISRCQLFAALKIF